MKWLKFRVWYRRYPKPMVGEMRYFSQSEDDFPASCRKHQSDEWMQFTGLTDKNGREIYEGDVVNVNNYGGMSRLERVQFYTNAGFAAVHPFTDSGHHWAAHNCEVVGNIYENPELAE